MKKLSSALLVATPLILALAGTATLVATRSAKAQAPAAQAGAKPALTVTVTHPQRAVLPLRIQANGNIAAWQEASVGTEANGLRLTDVRVNVGEAVRRGQVLATFDAATVRSELAQGRAALAEADSALAEAAANGQRARQLRSSGALSEQQITQYLTAERTANARLEAAKAAYEAHELRLAQTHVLAPDDGVVSARSATVGAVLPAGQELFRIIRRGRVEWRAEVAAHELSRPGRV